jgi:hypothetical protein
LFLGVERSQELFQKDAHFVFFVFFVSFVFHSKKCWKVGKVFK